MAATDFQRAEEALDWVRRIHDPSFTDWEEHVAWLEEDPRNCEAFDSAVSMIETATRDLAPPEPLVALSVPVNDNLVDSMAPHRRWRRWAGGLGAALAAGLIAIVAMPRIMHKGAQPDLVQTAPGERRSITLDGTVIALNGGSRLRLDRGDMRSATLERGEAFFAVRHDAAHPFTVRAGGSVFQDIGTAFDVVEQARSTKVAVREGALLYDPGGAAVRLDGGQSISIADNNAAVRTIDTAAVGGWRVGRLSYRDAPLADVADDVARSIGEPVAVDPMLAGRQFSGVVQIDIDRPRMFRRMAAVMGVDIRRDPKGWRMVIPTRR